jgi:hypothetical protein
MERMPATYLTSETWITIALMYQVLIPILSFGVRRLEMQVGRGIA